MDDATLRDKIRKGVAGMSPGALRDRADNRREFFRIMENDVRTGVVKIEDLARYQKRWETASISEMEIEEVSKHVARLERLTVKGAIGG